MKGLGDLLRRFRKDNEMSQEALATSLGMTQQAISAIERGGGVNEEHWPAIEKVLEMSRVEIVTKCLNIDSSGSRGSMVNINASDSSSVSVSGGPVSVNKDEISCLAERVRDLLLEIDNKKVAVSCIKKLEEILEALSWTK